MLPNMYLRATYAPLAYESMEMAISRVGEAIKIVFGREFRDEVNGKGNGIVNGTVGHE